MKKLLLRSVLAISVSSIALAGCSSTTNSGVLGSDRQQLLLVSSQEVLQLSTKSYQESIQKARAQGVLDTDAAKIARLKGIARRLINHIGVYRNDTANWEWEVHTIKSDDLNAYVMPGGKVVFYTGIIDRLNLTDDEIAAIMGHEMAHAIREHARERLSGQYATQAGLGIATQVLGLSKGEAQLASLASDFGINRPHSRTQESEADKIGLNLMAHAGYDPRAAITLWQKMQRASQGEPPQFLSTHPSSTNRITSLRALLPQVMPIYYQSH